MKSPPSHTPYLAPLSSRVVPNVPAESRGLLEHPHGDGDDIAPGHAEPWMNRTIVGAGVTSALGDFCYETTTVILPGFLAVLGVPAFMLGVIEGVADAVAAFTKMASGYIADRIGARKSLVLIGYGLTPLGQVLIALAAGWPLLLAGRLISWFGKGLRGPLRDAIVIQAVSAKTRGRAFGFYRAADSVGAIAGPLLGVALLGWAQGMSWANMASPFRLVLWVSTIPGVLAVVAFLLLVKDPEQSANPRLRFVSSMRSLPLKFKRYRWAVGIFGLGDFSHSLLILAATTLLSPSLGIVHAAQMAGMLYVWRNVVQVIASYPIGILADRTGHVRVLVGGYGLGAVLGAFLAGAFLMRLHDLALLTILFTVAGLYTAVQEAMESTVTAEMVPRDTLVINYGALGIVNGATKFVSSAMVGWLWTVISPAASFALAAFLMAVGAMVLIRATR